MKQVREIPENATVLILTHEERQAIICAVNRFAMTRQADIEAANSDRLWQLWRQAQALAFPMAGHHPFR